MFITKFGYPEDRAATKIGDLPPRQWPTLWVVRRDLESENIDDALELQAEGVIESVYRNYLVDVAVHFDHRNWGDGLMFQPLPDSFLGIPVYDDFVPGPNWGAWNEEDHPGYDRLQEFADSLAFCGFEESDGWLIPVLEFMKMETGQSGERVWVYSVLDQIKNSTSYWKNPVLAQQSTFDTEIFKVFEMLDEHERANPRYWKSSK